MLVAIAPVALGPTQGAWPEAASFGVGPRSLRRVLQYFLFLEPRHRERPPFLLPLRERSLANLQPASGRGLDDRLSRRDIGATITRELSPRSGAELRRHRRVPGGRGARGGAGQTGRSAETQNATVSRDGVDISRAHLKIDTRLKTAFTQ